MTRRARVFASVVLGSLIIAGITAVAPPAVAAPPPKTPHQPLSVTHVPAAHARVPRMFAYSNAHFAAAAKTLPAGLVTAVRRDLHESAEAYLAKADAGSRAAQVVDSLSAGGVRILGSHLTGTTLTVNVATEAAAARVRATGATAVVGAPRAEKQTSPMIVESNVYPGEPFLSTWNSEPHLGAQCTIAFTGYKVTSSATPTTREPLSAGHCVLDGSKLASHSYAVPDGPAGILTDTQIANRTPIATTAKAKFGSGYDSSLLTATSGTTETPDLATWGYGTSEPNATNPILITGEEQAIVGDDLCKSGSRTGYSCGQVTDVNAVRSVKDDHGKTHSVSAIIATTCLQPGDSGGAAVDGSLAVGIDSFGSSNVGCNDPSYRAGFFPLVATSSHPSVAKQYGSAWELQVSLYAPDLTNPSTPGQTLHSSTDFLTGTVSGAGVGDYVAVYLDGATTTSRTAPVGSDGSWSYPLTTVPGGSHTFVALTRFGKYSASGETTGSMNVIQKVSVSKPTISGTARVGSTLTAKTIEVPSSGTVSYQWLSNGADVGTNQPTYVPVASDLTNTITVTVTGSAAGEDSSGSISSGATKAVVRGTLVTHRPVITGHRNVGQVLTATTTGWGPAGIGLSYQWLRNGKKIVDATDSTYTPVTGDRGAKIDVTVTGALDGYTKVSVASSKTSIATGYPFFDSVGVPSIDNASPAVGSVLTASPGIWAPGAPTITYQWRENGKAISKATKVTYTVSSHYLGKTITVTVTARESGFATMSLTSAMTALVTPAS